MNEIESGSEYRRVASDRRHHVSEARIKAEAAMVLLAGMLVIIVLVALGLIVWQGITIRHNQGQIATLIDAQTAEAADVKSVLEAQLASDEVVQKRIDEAVSAIAAEQYRALVAHDRRVQVLLADALRIGNQELNGASNQEDRVIAPLLPIPRPQTAPQVGPSTGVAPAPKPAPAPAPAPKPAPCQRSGKSGKCSK